MRSLHIAVGHGKSVPPKRQTDAQFGRRDNQFGRRDGRFGGRDGRIGRRNGLFYGPVFCGLR